MNNSDLINTIINKNLNPNTRLNAIHELAQNSCNPSVFVECMDDSGLDYAEIIIELAECYIKQSDNYTHEKIISKIINILTNQRRLLYTTKKKFTTILFRLDPSNKFLYEYLTNTISSQNEPLLYNHARDILSQMNCKEFPENPNYSMDIIDERSFPSRSITNYTDDLSITYRKNYRLAFHYFYDHHTTIPNITHFRNLHKILIDGVLEPTHGSIGGVIRGLPDDQLRLSFDVSKYPTITQVPILLDQLFEWFTQNHDKIDCSLLATHMYKQLLIIHPFYDGCGRSSRLFVDWVIAYRGYFIKQYTDEYILAMMTDDNTIANSLIPQITSIDELDKIMLTIH